MEPDTSRRFDAHMLPEQRADAGEIVFGVDARRRRAGRDLDDDAMAMPQRPQLLERLERLDRRGRERRKRPQEAHAIRVQTIVPVQRKVRRNRALADRRTRRAPTESSRG